MLLNKKKSQWLFAVRTGLEPVTPCVTGMYSNQTELTHRVGCELIVESVEEAVRTGLEPVTPCVTGMYSNQTELTHRGLLQRTLERAANETRTRDPDLGKVVLYQLSYCRNFFL